MMACEIKTMFVAGLLVFAHSISTCSASFVRPTISGCDTVVDEGTWCAGALSERQYAASSTPDPYVPSSSDSVTLLSFVKEIAQLVTYEYINLTNRSGGIYNSWYAQYSTAGYTNIGEWLATVSNPPQWTDATILEYRGLPANYWSYSPARLVEATTIGYTNESTQAGFDAIDYGWERLHQVLLAMEDLYFNVGHVRQEVSGSDYEFCMLNAPSCGVPLVFATNSPVAMMTAEITIGNLHLFSGAYEPNTNLVVGRGGNIISSSRFKYGVQAGQNIVTQIVTRTAGEFQWYDFVSVHVVATVLTNVIPHQSECYFTYQHDFIETNFVSSGYSLKVFTPAHEIDDYGFYGTSSNMVYVASDAWILPDPVTITCPPGWYDRGQPCESDNFLVISCEMGSAAGAGSTYVAYASSANIRSGLAVGIARPEFVFQ